MPPSEQFLRVERRPAEGYALIVLCREPVNTMNLAFWQQLASTLDELEADPSVRGVIFASGLKRDVFTAGNDINELYAPLTSRERYRWGQLSRQCRQVVACVCRLHTPCASVANFPPAVAQQPQPPTCSTVAACCETILSPASAAPPSPPVPPPFALLLAPGCRSTPPSPRSCCWLAVGIRFS